EYDTEHPPLARALIALGPYVAGARSFGTPPPDGTQEGIDILYSNGHYDLYLTLARLGTLPFLALLLVTTWLWARRLTRSSGEARPVAECRHETPTCRPGRGDARGRRAGCPGLRPAFRHRHRRHSPLRLGAILSVPRAGARPPSGRGAGPRVAAPGDEGLHRGCRSAQGPQRYRTSVIPVRSRAHQRLVVFLSRRARGEDTDPAVGDRTGRHGVARACRVAG